MLNEIEKGQLSISTAQCFIWGGKSLSQFPGLIKKVIEERVWERRSHHGRIIELPNLRALITEKPIRGWGQDPRKIEAIIKDDADALVMFRKAMNGEHGGDRKSKQTEIKCNNVTLDKPVTGNSKSYTLSRLKKDRPDLFKRVAAKELSANAAAIEAGWRKTKTPFDQLLHWWQKASATEREKFLQRVNCA